MYDKHSTIINTKNNSKISRDIICTECGEICLIKFEDYKIKLYDCKNNHKEYIYLNDYNETQKIDETKVICKLCKKKKSESYNNKFFICGVCNIYCCPLCSSIHSKEHKLIDYDNKNFLCHKHNEQFISYCETCKYNLCLQCELEHNNSHKIISYKSIYPNLNNIKNKLKEIENVINEFNDDINKIIDILMKIKNNINKYYEINYKILNNFEIDKRNYQILKNINNIDLDIHCNIIIENLKSIVKEKNDISKFNKIYELYSNIINNNFSNNNLNKIKIIKNIDNNLSDKSTIINEKNNNNLIYNRNEIKFLNENIIEDSYARLAFDNTFCVFNSCNDILYLVFANYYKSIIFYNLLDKKIIKEIKCAHEEHISNFRYLFDNISKNDFVLSVSSKNRNVKLWNINSDICLFNIYAYKNGFLDSACFLKNDNQYYILITNSFSIKNNDTSENIKILNFSGNEIMQIENSNERAYFIDTYYDNFHRKII